MGLTLKDNYTEEKLYFEEYLGWTQMQQQILEVEDTDTNGLEHAIYQKKLLIGKIREQHQEAQWLTKSLQSGPEELALREEIYKLMEQIQIVEESNIQLAAARKSHFGEQLRKMQMEHKAARGYNNVGFYPQAGLFDEKK